MDSNQLQAAAGRLASKLDALSLDDDERAVLLALLGNGAASIEPADADVEGFAYQPYIKIKGQKQGSRKGLMDDEGPEENVTFVFGGLSMSYMLPGLG